MLTPIDYVSDDIWRRADFYQVFPLDGGGYFSFLDVIGATDDRTVADATMSGRAFQLFRDPDGRVNWERYDRWDTAEKGVWLNRWYYLPSTARMYWITREEKYGRVVRDIIAEWCAAVPVPDDYPSYFKKFRAGFDAGDRGTDERACSTWCDFQLAQRILSAYWLTWFLRDSTSWSKQDWSRLADSMMQHARFLYWADRGGRFEPGNHQMLRGFALLHAAVMMKEAREAEAWWQVGARIMTQHAAGDFTTEGISREGSFSYQVFTLSQFLHAIALAQAAGKPVPDAWPAVARKMARFVALTATPGLTTPVVNDGYEADLAPLIDLYAARMPELSGARQTPGAGIRLESFADAGVVVVDARDHPSRLWLLAECMPPYGHSGHWHAGKPTLHIWIGKQMLLGDCGCPNYDDPLYGSWYRRGPAHFAVTVDGKEDADFVSDIRWENPPEVKVTRCEQTHDSVVARFKSNGFLRLADQVTYIREIALEKDRGLIIRDRLASRNPDAAHVFRLHVPFTVSEVHRASPDTFAATLDAGRVFMRWHVTEGRARVELTKKPVQIGPLTGEYPCLQIEVSGVAQTEFVLEISADLDRHGSG